MKSVIINLKYLIFRSMSASEGGWLEEQQRQGEGAEERMERVVLYHQPYQQPLL